MKNLKKIVLAIVIALLACQSFLGLVACNKGNNDNPGGQTQQYDPEKRPLSMSISTPDGVFSPFFSTSAYDSSIVVLTQLSMLSTDSEGSIVCGEDEPTVVKDYTVTEEKEGSETKYTTYEFLIKNGIKFSDGVDLTIKDVLFNLYVYLDPAYTGSATMYSTDIVGLKEYRQQQKGSTSDSTEFEQSFVDQATVRIDKLIDFVTYYYTGTKEADRGSDLWTDEADYNKAIADIKYVQETFNKELLTDWNAIELDSYKDWTGFDAVWKVFLMNDGGETGLLKMREDGRAYAKNEKGNYIIDEEYAAEIKIDIDEAVAELKADPANAGKQEEELIRDYCIDRVYSSYFRDSDVIVKVNGENKTRINPSNFATIVKYWATASTILDQFTAEAKTDYFKGSTKVVPNISGITTAKVTSFNNKSLDGEYDVLRIKINGVDPKAIYNFSFTVSPMHYYSSSECIAKYNGVSEFGVEFGDINFMNNVLNASSKVGLPVGAGAYMASTANGNAATRGSEFFNNNMVYYERNPYFTTVGKEIENAKIKYIRYKVVETDQIINALTNGDIDFGDPSATIDNQDAIDEANRTKNAGITYAKIKTNGYGYVGINPRFVPSIDVRRAIMKAMDTQTIINNYYRGGFAELINRPMSTTSWAYPKGVTTYTSENGTDYALDKTGSEIEKLVQDAGYTKNSNGVYEKTIEGFGTDTLNYTFTIAGGSNDHPAYKMFLDAKEILNAHGFDVKVVCSQTALSDLSNGKLAVWAAAWSSTIDPDMYQVYHIDSQASSTSNWGYKQIKAGKTSTYRTEYEIITRLSEKIDAGRATTNTQERTTIYAEALDLVMELAVEMPTYQRFDMSAFNGKILDEKTMTPEAERSPYNGLLSRIWEVNYK